MAGAYEIPGFSFTLLAGIDLSTSKFCAVDVNSSAQAVLPTAGGRAIGVVQNNPALGQPATVVQTGITKAKVGTGGITAGQNVQALADGTFTAAVSTKYAIGIALQTGVAGTLVAVLLTPSGGGGLIA